jgi:hypothetical protein
MRDFKPKQIIYALPVIALAFVFIVAMLIYLIPIIPLVVIAAKAEKKLNVRMGVIEKPVGIYAE